MFYVIYNTVQKSLASKDPDSVASFKLVSTDSSLSFLKILKVLIWTLGAFCLFASLTQITLAYESFKHKTGT